MPGNRHYTVTVEALLPVRVEFKARIDGDADAMTATMQAHALKRGVLRTGRVLGADLDRPERVKVLAVVERSASGPPDQSREADARSRSQADPYLEAARARGTAPAPMEGEADG